MGDCGQSLSWTPSKRSFWYVFCRLIEGFCAGCSGFPMTLVLCMGVMLLLGQGPAWCVVYNEYTCIYIHIYICICIEREAGVEVSLEGTFSACKWTKPAGSRPPPEEAAAAVAPAVRTNSDVEAPYEPLVWAATFCKGS